MFDFPSKHLQVPAEEFAQVDLLQVSPDEVLKVNADVDVFLWRTTNHDPSL
jgi:hypothetical protein